jgi:hypothetical protein
MRIRKNSSMAESLFLVDGRTAMQRPVTAEASENFTGTMSGRNVLTLPETKETSAAEPAVGAEGTATPPLRWLRLRRFTRICARPRADQQISSTDRRTSAGNAATLRIVMAVDDRLDLTATHCRWGH